MANLVPQLLCFSLVSLAHLGNSASSPTYMGCFVDSSDRILPDDFKLMNGTLTPSICVDYCQSNGFPYAGMQYGEECFCGAGLPCPFIRADESDCDMDCEGDSQVKCGAGWRNSVYTTSNIVEPQNCEPPEVDYASVDDTSEADCQVNYRFY